MKNTKKIIAVLVAVILAVAGVFVACSKGGETAENTVKGESAEIIERK